MRGLHYQLNPHAQGKLVRVVQGRAWDVAVDIRENSPTFGEWVGVELTGDNHKQFWIPAGFAHGFIALEDNTQFLYKTTNYYSKECERSIVWNDADFAIEWPIENGIELKLTDKDRLAPTFSDAKIKRFILSDHMMSPLVSVVVPSYNHEKFLKERLDSILNQTFQDFELIILDDLSPDNSREIIETYRAHPKVSKIVYNEKTQGLLFSVE